MEEPVWLEPLFPDRTSGENLAVQLARRLRDAIEKGVLRTGTRVLGTRLLAKRLGLGRNTVTLAFEQLTAEGYFETRSGAGTFVAASEMKRPARPRATARTQPMQARRMESLRMYFDVATGRGPLRPGMPDLSKFPSASWKRSSRKALEIYGSDLGYGPAAGLRSLREAIAAHVGQFRGVTTQAENVVVVEGAQAAIHLAAFVLAPPGARIVVEDPCYALARAAFEAFGLQLHPVAVDDDGIRVDALPRDASLAFVTPTHQFPLGGTLPVSRRMALLAWARETNAYVIEDDYDSEFTSKTRPLPALQSLDRDERVVYVGSFSKTLAPVLRLGFIIAPPHLAKAFRAARASAALGVAVALQATVSDFIVRGHFARHIRKMNAVYERRRSILADAMTPYLGSAFRLGPMQTGLHVAVTGRRDFDDVGASEAPGEQRLVALSRLCVARRDCRGFVLGFTNGSDDAIRRAATLVVQTLV
jgi:GntR family transcriptional regulator/MocR family aminotransferase